MALLAIQKSLTIEQAVTATISREVGKKIGAATLHKIVCAVLKLFCESLNLGQPMNAIQVYETAGFWIENNPTDSIKDLIMCLKLAKQSKYGKIYNRFDSEVFGDFWSQYLEYKAEYRENQHKDMKAAEATNEKAVITQIEQHLPGTLTAFKVVRLMPTPSAPIPDHNHYLCELSEKLPFASEDEMQALRAQATEAKLTDIIELIDNELTSRKQ
ncbi:hypothetical protein GCM10028810_01650 [Spirosoma litoris]